MQESIVFLVRVQCRRTESSRSLSHLLMSFLYHFITIHVINLQTYDVCMLEKNKTFKRSKKLSKYQFYNAQIHIFSF